MAILFQPLKASYISEFPLVLWSAVNIQAQGDDCSWISKHVLFCYTVLGCTCLSDFLDSSFPLLLSETWKRTLLNSDSAFKSLYIIDKRGHFSLVQGIWFLMVLFPECAYEAPGHFWLCLFVSMTFDKDCSQLHWESLPYAGSVFWHLLSHSCFKHEHVSKMIWIAQSCFSSLVTEMRQSSFWTGITHISCAILECFNE